MNKVGQSIITNEISSLVVLGYNSIILAMYTYTFHKLEFKTSGGRKNESKRINWSIQRKVCKKDPNERAESYRV